MLTQEGGGDTRAEGASACQAGSVLCSPHLTVSHRLSSCMRAQQCSIWSLSAPHVLCDISMPYCRHHSPPQGSAPAPPPGGCPSAISLGMHPAQSGAPSRAAPRQRQSTPFRTAQTGSSSTRGSTACTESTTQSACGPAWLLQLQTQQVGLRAGIAAVLEATATLSAACWPVVKPCLLPSCCQSGVAVSAASAPGVDTSLGRGTCAGCMWAKLPLHLQMQQMAGRLVGVTLPGLLPHMLKPILLHFSGRREQAQGAFPAASSVCRWFA